MRSKRRPLIKRPVTDIAPAFFKQIPESRLTGSDPKGWPFGLTESKGKAFECDGRKRQCTALREIGVESTHSND